MNLICNKYGFFAYMVWIMFLKAESTGCENIDWLLVKFVVWIMLLVVESTSCKNIHLLLVEQSGANFAS